MLINVRGPGPEGSDVTHKIQQGLGAKLHTQLVAKFGRRLVGREVWATLPNGSLKRIDTQASPQDYGFAQEDAEWSLFIRTPPIPECALSSSTREVFTDPSLAKTRKEAAGNPAATAAAAVAAAAASAGGAQSMSWSRDPSTPAKKTRQPLQGGRGPTAAAAAAAAAAQQAAAAAAAAPSKKVLPKKAHLRRLANKPSGDQMLRSLNTYHYTLNDAVLSRDFSRSVLSEVVQMHLKGSLTAKTGVPDTALSADETHGGVACWATGEHHTGVRRWLRLIDACVASLPGLELSGRSPALVSCYNAGGSRGALHEDAACDGRRKLTATTFLQLQQSEQKGGSAGELCMRTESNEVRIAPLLGRVLLHWSDGRCLHEIRPTLSQAFYSITTFYYAKDVPAPPAPLPAAADAPRAAALTKTASSQSLSQAYPAGAVGVGGGGGGGGGPLQKKKKKK
eukprot:Rhum_TRINITY_DN10527_c1_g1::Rhum_TRINITY_DN10527_c1_g1_i1::g.38913::m.38913/K09592/EGLN, HPH; hypoxia-inducible factor prolyl hydroxylase